MCVGSWDASNSVKRKGHEWSDDLDTASALEAPCGSGRVTTSSVRQCTCLPL